MSIDPLSLRAAIHTLQTGSEKEKPKALAVFEKLGLDFEAKSLKLADGRTIKLGDHAESAKLARAALPHLIHADEASDDKAFLQNLSQLSPEDLTKFDEWLETISASLIEYENKEVKSTIKGKADRLISDTIQPFGKINIHLLQDTLRVRYGIDIEKGEAYFIEKGQTVSKKLPFDFPSEDTNTSFTNVYDKKAVHSYLTNIFSWQKEINLPLREGTFLERILNNLKTICFKIGRLMGTLIYKIALAGEKVSSEDTPVILKALKTDLKKLKNDFKYHLERLSPKNRSEYAGKNADQLAREIRMTLERGLSIIDRILASNDSDLFQGAERELQKLHKEINSLRINHPVEEKARPLEDMGVVWRVLGLRKTIRTAYNDLLLYREHISGSKKPDTW